MLKPLNLQIDISNENFLFILDMTYCARVSDEEYRSQTEECTEQALVDLMNSVLDNTQFSLKEKKQRLKQFQKHHPYLHEKYFSNIK